MSTTQGLTVYAENSRLRKRVKELRGRIEQAYRAGFYDGRGYQDEGGEFIYQDADEGWEDLNSQ
ncbi:hypothetical protein LCGC14_0373580 [marine sediment metagenome]|uniref:Uncharacterized protein n=1 Tax=marine sediment metagenome TaxID=412755 RepID=A0A0F9WD52_9ZZZZ